MYWGDKFIKIAWNTKAPSIFTMKYFFEWIQLFVVIINQRLLQEFVFAMFKNGLYVCYHHNISIFESSLGTQENVIQHLF